MAAVQESPRGASSRTLCPRGAQASDDLQRGVVGDGAKADTKQSQVAVGIRRLRPDNEAAFGLPDASAADDAWTDSRMDFEAPRPATG